MRQTGWGQWFSMQEKGIVSRTAKPLTTRRIAAQAASFQVSGISSCCARVSISLSRSEYGIAFSFLTGQLNQSGGS
ncbi:hypothetical protein ACO9S2_06980 [Nitrospira sp. NS4]